VSNFQLRISNYELRILFSLLSFPPARESRSKYQKLRIKMQNDKEKIKSNRILYLLYLLLNIVAQKKKFIILKINKNVEKNEGQEAKKCLKEVLELILDIKNRFHVWKNLLNSDYQKVYDDFPYFVAQLPAILEQSIIINIAMLFEKKKRRVEKKYGKVVSIYRLLDFIDAAKKKTKIEVELRSKREILKTINMWRSKHYVHKDEKVVFKKIIIEKAHPLYYGDIQNIVEWLEDLYNNINLAITNKGGYNSMSNYERESKLEVDYVMDLLNTNKNK